MDTLLPRTHKDRMDMRLTINNKGLEWMRYFLELIKTGWICGYLKVKTNKGLEWMRYFLDLIKKGWICGFLKLIKDGMDSPFSRSHKKRWIRCYLKIIKAGMELLFPRTHYGDMDTGLPGTNCNNNITQIFCSCFGN